MDAGEPLAFHQRMYDPSRVTVIAVGNGSHEALGDTVDAAFGSWQVEPGGRIHADPVALPIPPGAAELLVIVAGRRAAVGTAHSAMWRWPEARRDYHALVTLNLVLGGQFVSRINSNLRERKGYTYGARTSFEFRRGRGPFALAASVQSDATADAVREALGELHAIRGERPVTVEELELGRAPTDARVPARVRDRRADQSRHRPDCALRPARRLLHDVRTEGARPHARGPDACRRRPTSTPLAS